MAEIVLGAIAVASSERLPRAHQDRKTGDDAECGDDRDSRPAGQGHQ
jgi:hypothetical protein